MKAKFLIVIVLLVAAVHISLFLMTQNRDTPPEVAKAILDSENTTEPENRNMGSSPSSLPSTPPIAPPKDESSEVAVEEAVSLIQNNASLGTSRPPASSTVENELPQPREEEAAQSDATMIVGLVEGQSKLSPELNEVAKEGAKAVAMQDWERARELYLEMVKKAPENALGYANLGVAEHQMGNLLAATGNLKKSLEINPSIAQNWQTLGIIHYERDELELAISSLTRAIHEDPSDPRSRLYLAAVIRSYGWIEASITELERAVETDPEFADAHFNLAVSYLETEPPRIELARRHYYSAIDLGAAPSSELESTLRSPTQNE